MDIETLLGNENMLKLCGTVQGMVHQIMFPFGQFFRLLQIGVLNLNVMNEAEYLWLGRFFKRTRSLLLII